VNLLTTPGLLIGIFSRSRRRAVSGVKVICKITARWRVAADFVIEQCDPLSDSSFRPEMLQTG
jgi:hypothetical protein